MDINYYELEQEIIEVLEKIKYGYYLHQKMIL